MLPLFRALDNSFLGDSERSRQTAGEYARTPRRAARCIILDAVADAAEEIGIPKTRDFNTGDNEGVSYFHVNQKNGRRWSAARALLDPQCGCGASAGSRPGALTEKGLCSKAVRAVGVRFRQEGRLVEARARGEVILSAGAIGSVEILQRSGIGPGPWLNDLGIPVFHALEGVGRNQQDHLQLLRHVPRLACEDAEPDLLQYPLARAAAWGSEYALLGKDAAR